MIGRAVKEKAIKYFNIEKKKYRCKLYLCKLHITERKLREVAAGKGATITWKKALCP